MNNSPVELWMRNEITTGKLAELLGIDKRTLHLVVDPLLNALGDAVADMASFNAPTDAHDHDILCWCGVIVRETDDVRTIIHRSVQMVAGMAIAARLPVALDVLPGTSLAPKPDDEMMEIG